MRRIYFGQPSLIGRVPVSPFCFSDCGTEMYYVAFRFFDVSSPNFQTPLANLISLFAVSLIITRLCFWTLFPFDFIYRLSSFKSLAWKLCNYVQNVYEHNRIFLFPDIVSTSNFEVPVLITWWKVYLSISSNFWLYSFIEVKDNPYHPLNLIFNFHL